MMNPLDPYPGVPPCKRIKCLVYSVCISNDSIKCSTLYEHYLELVHANRGLANKSAKTWGTMRMVFPQLLSIIKPEEYEEHDG